MDRFFEVNAVLSKFSKNYMDLKKGLPIRPSEMGVLNIITGTEGPHTPVMIAELLGVSKAMITAHINSLESKGYIMKDRSAPDGRAYYICPTDKALELVESAKTEMNRQLKSLIGCMGQEEFDTFIRLAKTANRVLENKGE